MIRALCGFKTQESTRQRKDTVVHHLLEIQEFHVLQNVSVFVEEMRRFGGDFFKKNSVFFCAHTLCTVFVFSKAFSLRLDGIRCM